MVEGRKSDIKGNSSRLQFPSFPFTFVSIISWTPSERVFLHTHSWGVLLNVDRNIKKACLGTGNMAHCQRRLLLQEKHGCCGIVRNEAVNWGNCFHCVSFIWYIRDVICIYSGVKGWYKMFPLRRTMERIRKWFA